MVKHFSKRKKVHLFYSISWKHVSGRQILRKLKLFFILNQDKNHGILCDKNLFFFLGLEKIFLELSIFFFQQKSSFLRKTIFFILKHTDFSFSRRKIRYFFERVKPFQKKVLGILKRLDSSKQEFFSNSTQFSFWKKV